MGSKSSKPLASSAPIASSPAPSLSSPAPSTSSSAPKASASSSPSAPSSSVASLFFSTSSGGVCVMHWEGSKGEGTLLAQFVARKPVPAHKKTINGGRMELSRGAAGSRIKLYEGVIAFVKEAVAFDGDLMVLDGELAEVWYLEGVEVKRANVGVAVKADKFTAVGVVNAQRGDLLFKGIKSTDVGHFTGVAIREGAAWKR